MGYFTEGGAFRFRTKASMSESEILHNQAENLLKESKLIEKLSIFGKVKISGSFSYNLMTQPDIDIYVANINVKETFKDILMSIVDDEIFKFGVFQNLLKKTKPNLPYGFYIGLNKKFDDVKFNVDVWVVNDLDEIYNKYPKKEVALINYLESENVTKQEREVILRLKKYKQDMNLPLKSFQIYDAVINHKISTTDDLDKLILANS